MQGVWRKRPASVSMGGGAANARSAEGPASVSMGGSAANARSAEGAASVSMGGGAVDARSAWLQGREVGNHIRGG